ncbi:MULTISPECIES: aspartate 1-decarboxylase [Lactiplantibacillus]|uniref:Aspartate 1-decarboxylase n=2 Tax=Lactiplantibacillus plantarum TaxID=1590 RepID=PAND_LACPL|nr:MULTISPECIES: aspartate 1-decarboxylase [Lactiplantibacillus]Q88Z02.1 RecName: Full=Aspartate 1-decarboxylase; AltName: Full=Aspartate alpha-decarboxylase; Contains: RecName: Full=Aspartate 1-decarboxylase beta chain; Contains: RecName: Full=Aspartate 1-decarboxylase alpha chain; Flags: Precursor [Lactiplantibacillus plantarum WCFS1]AJO73278.1 aspartate decarboxylase [Lactiplantibacillus plantarum]ARO05842.1 aspartate 1-decarboxylase [Lactiplantibacillus plantarum]KKX45553.1 aspartate decarb
MLIDMLKGKIHRATVTQADLEYVGSITIDETLMEASGILEYEKVQIADVNNGARFETYVIAGPRDSGVICLNGATARCASVGDKVIIMNYAQFEPEEAKHAKPYVVLVDDENRLTKRVRYEKHGLLAEEL